MEYTCVELYMSGMGKLAVNNFEVRFLQPYDGDYVGRNM